MNRSGPSPPLAEYEFERRFDESGAIRWMQQNWDKSFVICFAYALFVFAGRRYMRERPKWDLRGPLALWSLSLAIFSILGAVRTDWYMLNVLQHSGFRQSVCDSAFYRAPVTKFWAFAFTLSKVPELGDTLFIVLRKQKLMFLHWYHHITVLLYTWYTYKDEVAGGSWFITMNFTVHAVMYSYYAARAAGVRVPRACAVLITACQILQMVMGLAVLLMVYGWMHAQHCASNLSNVTWGSLMYLSYLLLFASFFYESYLVGPAAKGRKAE
ncbi:elongation of very long chain fatty acids protein 6-like [Denticeps clupeoides]|uniref:Elongation of very long chain fatty acids protein n=1 Tax=Denticeps clupeoides TaxID=299321 RepID=A0AAY4AKF8_9TELE|nr:elongation of very long chain fatty acids protein 6-like [Denticeps clupeoides]